MTNPIGLKGTGLTDRGRSQQKRALYQGMTSVVPNKPIK
jgi:hypothetical protein